MPRFDFIRWDDPWTCEKNGVFNFVFGLGRWIYGVSSHLTVSRHSPMRIAGLANTSAQSTSQCLWGTSVSYPPSILHPAARSATSTRWPVCPVRRGCGFCAFLCLSRATNHSKSNSELPSGHDMSAAGSQSALLFRYQAKIKAVHLRTYFFSPKKETGIWNDMFLWSRAGKVSLSHNATRVFLFAPLVRINPKKSFLSLLW